MCDPFLEFNEVVIKGYVAGSMCLFAILGNTFSAFVLSSRKMRSFPMNRILLALSLVDLTFGLTNFVYQVMITFADYYCMYSWFYYSFHPFVTPIVYPIEVAAQLTSIYLTVLVSFERYLAVCRPFQTKIWCTTKRSTYLCICIAVLCCLYTLPLWFESTSTSITFPTPDNGTQHGYFNNDTPLALNADYKYYYVQWGTFLVFRFFPFIILVMLNGLIFKAILEMNKRRKAMTKFQAEEISVTKMLLPVILVFLLCNTVKIYVYVAGLYQTYSMVEHVADLLVMSNPSFNFIIYCFFSAQFRAHFLRMFGCLCIRKPTLASNNTFLTTITRLH